MSYEILFSITMLSLIIVLYYFSVTKHLNRERILINAEKLAANNQLEEAIELLEEYDAGYEIWLSDTDLSPRVEKIIRQYTNYLSKISGGANSPLDMEEIAGKIDFYKQINPQIAI